MTNPSDAIPSSDHAQAVAWFVELARAVRRGDAVREAEALARLRRLGVEVRLGAPMAQGGSRDD